MYKIQIILDSGIRSNEKGIMKRGRRKEGSQEEWWVGKWRNNNELM